MAKAKAEADQILKEFSMFYRTEGTLSIAVEPINSKAIKKTVELEKEISEAVHLLGYNIEKHTLTVSATLFGRYKVLMDNKYFGIWDCRRKTFVD